MCIFRFVKEYWLKDTDVRLNVPLSVITNEGWWPQNILIEDVVGTKIKAKRVKK